ncbi:hydrolase 1, exosortase A system-associated [Rheinheimera sp. WS51]|uniref:hydrolase 1, exosortase A system-associated n=1 Tax=Rheinheimera sp. WS51 TaxID=3425886 RepID=UPI003D934D91
MSAQFIEINSKTNKLSAILHPASGAIGVLIIVGGPQYRVGSHRQFVKLSQHLSAHSIPSLRLDSSGMGDSSGEKTEFYQQTADIDAAIETMFTQMPQLQKVVLWGLCDAASAILLKMNHADPRIAGLILLNPWVRQEQSHAATMLKHYYVKRLVSREFWRKIFSGGLAFKRSITDFWQTWRSSKQQSTLNSAKQTEYSASNYVQHMLTGWQKTNAETLLISSGNDLTAQEFLDLCLQNAQWQQCFNKAKRLHINEANHTFSSAKWRKQVEQASSDFILAMK